MRLFDDDLERTSDATPARHVGRYKYLNESGRIEAKRVRGLLEDFANLYPAADLPELANRLRRDEKDSYQSAVFELILLGLFVQAGHTLLAVEPELTHTPSSPDFEFRAPNGQRFYLEATLATGLTAADKGREKLRQEVLNALDEVHSPNYWLELSVRGRPKTMPKLGRLRKRVQAWVDDLPKSDPGRELNIFKEEVDDLRIIIQLGPRRRPSGRAGRTFGSEIRTGFAGLPGEHCRSALKDKAGKFGDLRAPYLVAVNSSGSGSSFHDVESVLFGLTQSVQGREDMRRQAGGLWRDGEVWRNTRMSGVLYFYELSPWNVALRRGLLIPHPDARYKLPDLGLGLDVGAYSRPSLHIEQRQKLGECLGLGPNWPEAIN